jgi:hypothetical protein
MTDFVVISGKEHINIDLVWRITQDVGNKITLHTASGKTRTLEGADATYFMDEVVKLERLQTKLLLEMRKLSPSLE